MVIGKPLSFWETLCSSAMLVSGRVIQISQVLLKPTPMLRPCAAGRKKIVGEQRGNLKPSVKGRRFTPPENSYGTNTNHQIEKENHLNQTIILVFQGVLILAYEKSRYNWVAFHPPILCSSR